MTFNFTPHTDSGTPEFSNIDGELAIICKPGDRGRWLCDWQEPMAPGANLQLNLAVRTTGPAEFRASIFLIWWDAAQPGYVVKETEFATEIPAPTADFVPIDHIFTVPEGVKPLRVDCRAWSAAGNAHFKDFAIVPAAVPPDPDPPDPDPVPPAHQLTIDLQLNSATWRVTANEDSITALRIPKESN